MTRSKGEHRHTPKKRAKIDGRLPMKNLILPALLLLIPIQALALDAARKHDQNDFMQARLNRINDLEVISKFAEAQSELKETLEKLPNTAPALTRADILFRVANLPGEELDLDKLKEAIILYKNANANSPNELIAHKILSARYYRIKKFQLAEETLADSLPLEQRLHGKHLLYSISLVNYARTASSAGKNRAAKDSISEALRLAESEKSVDEKREHLPNLYSEVAAYYQFQKNDRSSACKFYSKAIYSGESLWYPLYDETMRAMYANYSIQNEAGNKKAAEELAMRLNAISRTGHDPKGKDVCKYWNGKTAPSSGGSIPIPEIKGQPSSFPIKGTPQEIYKAYLRN